MSNSPGGIFEDRKAQIAVFLSFIVIVVYSELVLKPQQLPVDRSLQQQQQMREPAQPEVEQGWSLPKVESPPVTETTTPPVIEQSSQAASLLEKPSTIPTVEEYRQGEIFTVQNSLFTAELPGLGAGILSFRLSDYTKDRGGDEPLDLIYPSDHIPLPLSVQVGDFADYTINYSLVGEAPQGNRFEVKPGSPLRIPFEATLADGTKITKIYEFLEGTYLFDVEVHLTRPTRDAAPVQLVWTGTIPDEIAQSSYDPVSFMILDSEDDVETLPLGGVEEGAIERVQARWLSLGDKYFMSTLISPQGSGAGVVAKRGEVYTTALAGSSTGGKYKVYVGPKEYNDLEALGFSLQRNVDLGIFSFLAHPLLLLMNIFYSFLGNYGLSIILLTLFIKALFLPLTKVSFKSMQALQDLQPEMKALRERIKDPTELNREMLALYKKRGVNPMGGCLPMLIQLPVFLGLYNALLYATELRHADFALWINDLSAPEGLELFGIGIPVMLLLMGASMFLQQYLTPTAMDPQQRKVLLMMPIVFTAMFIIFPFPSGLVLYWLVNNLISIVQQVYLKSDRYAHPGRATVVASAAIFSFGYVLTLL